MPLETQTINYIAYFFFLYEGIDGVVQGLGSIIYLHPHEKVLGALLKGWRSG